MIRIREAPSWAAGGAKSSATQPFPAKGTSAPAKGDLIMCTLLTEEVICQVAGVRDTVELAVQTRLELCVDSNHASCSLVGEVMPALEEFILNDSIICSIRDLGTCLRNLRSLAVARCGLVDFDGCLSALPALTTLLAPFNQIIDVSALAGHEALETLDLEGNRIAEEDALTGLGLIPSLKSVRLWGNPLVFSLGPRYRHLVVSMAATISMLDDEAVEEREEGEGCGDDDRSKAVYGSIDAFAAGVDPGDPHTHPLRTSSSMHRSEDSPGSGSGSVPHSLRSRTVTATEEESGSTEFASGATLAVAGGRVHARPCTAATASSYTYRPTTASTAGASSSYGGTVQGGVGGSSSLTHGEGSSLMAGGLAAARRKGRAGGRTEAQGQGALDTSDASFMSGSTLRAELNSSIETEAPLTSLSSFRSQDGGGEGAGFRTGQRPMVGSGARLGTGQRQGSASSRPSTAASGADAGRYSVISRGRDGPVRRMTGISSTSASVSLAYERGRGEAGGMGCLPFARPGTGEEDADEGDPEDGYGGVDGGSSLSSMGSADMGPGGIISLGTGVHAGGHGAGGRGGNSSKGPVSLLALLDRAREEDERDRVRTACELKEWRAALKSGGRSREAAIAAGPGLAQVKIVQALEVQAPAPLTEQRERGPVPIRAPVPGEWVTWGSDPLIALLRAKPKHTPQLHSRAEFRRFFAAISRPALRALLHKAYSGQKQGDGEDGVVATPSEVEDRISRRMELMDGAFAEDAETQACT